MFLGCFVSISSFSPHKRGFSTFYLRITLVTTDEDVKLVGNYKLMDEKSNYELPK